MRYCKWLMGLHIYRQSRTDSTEDFVAAAHAITGNKFVWPDPSFGHPPKDVVERGSKSGRSDDHRGALVNYFDSAQTGVI